MIYNGDLGHLYNKLPEFMMSSKAESTQRKYRYAFNIWCKWTNNYNLYPLPVSYVHISLYLMHLSESAKSVSKLYEAEYAISWAHKLAGFVDPCTNELVSSFREGARSKIGHIVDKKKPITPLILQNIVQKYAFSNCNLKDIRIACICLISYVGWFSEIFRISWFEKA